MTYRDPVTGKFAKQPKSPPLVHGLEWDEEEPDVDLLGGPTARQLWLFAIAAVIVIVAVAALVQPS